MQRRTLLKGAVAVGAAGIGAGYWVLPTGAAPAAVSLEGVREVLAQLQGQALVSIKGWTPAQVFNHCAQSIDFSIEGYPELKAPWFRNSVGPLAFSVFEARGAMRHPLDEIIPGAGPLLEPQSQEAALARLAASFERFAAHQGELAPHFAYGQLSHEQYEKAHVMHLYNHLSLLKPLA